MPASQDRLFSLFTKTALMSKESTNSASTKLYSVGERIEERRV